MFSLLLSRFGSALLVVLGVCTLVFLLIHLVPGDPVEAMLGESAQPADREALRAALGLDRPVSEQYLDYLGRLVRLDLGSPSRIAVRYGAFWASASRRPWS